VFNDGFELNTKRKAISGSSDLKKLLSNYEEKNETKGQANIVSREQMEASGNWNMRPFYYMEDIPDVTDELVYLDKSIIKEISTKVNLQEKPDESFDLLQVSQNGIFLADTILGAEATQRYKLVRAGDIVYNPYRVNIGSIGVVPKYLDNSFVSPAYVVVRSKDENFPSSYIVSILKHPRYLRVIMNYALSSARASLPYSELIRIKIPRPTKERLNELIKLDNRLQDELASVNQIAKKVAETAGSYIK